jgi:glycerol-3-phosphate dehydrogenase (NAD+)
MPQISLPSNIIASNDLKITIQDADIIIFAIPHQYIIQIVNSIKGLVKSTCIPVSLSKGLMIEPNGPKLISDMITEILGTTSSCAVLMVIYYYSNIFF